MSARRLSIVFIGMAIALVSCAQAPIAAAPAPTPTPVPTAAVARTTAAQGFAGGTRVSGSVQSVSGNSITLSDGSAITANAQTRIARVESITPADLKAGLYVAVTAQRQPDNTLLASQVNVFDESRRGVGAGQRPMTGGNLMTNATISTVSGTTFTVTWEGGGANVKLAPDAKVTRTVALSMSDVKPGNTISVVEGNGGVAQAITLQ